MVRGGRSKVTPSIRRVRRRTSPRACAPGKIEPRIRSGERGRDEKIVHLP